MGNLSGKFDPNAEPSNDFSPFPTGTYNVQAIDGDVKPTKNNDGEFVEFTNEVLDGPLKGRRIWTRFNLTHTNPIAAQIGNEQLAKMRHACGLDGNADDTSHYLWKPHTIRVEFYPAGTPYTSGKRKGTVRDRDESEVKDWKRLEGAAPVAASPAAAPYARAAAPAHGGWNPPRAA